MRILGIRKVTRDILIILREEKDTVALQFMLSKELTLRRWNTALVSMNWTKKVGSWPYLLQAKLIGPNPVLKSS